MRPLAYPAFLIGQPLAALGIPVGLGIIAYSLFGFLGSRRAMAIALILVAAPSLLTAFAMWRVFGQRLRRRIFDPHVALFAAALTLSPGVFLIWKMTMTGRYSVTDRVNEIGDAARARLKPFFDDAGVDYPPSSFVLVAFKDERRLELYAARSAGAERFIRAWPIRGTSGSLGPKLREGDGQVPEGFYRIESLNPNSRFHLSLRLDYPNASDRERAGADGRTALGGDIMIHGGSASVGCLAMTDAVAEELFVLAADAGHESGAVVISPVDFRSADLPANFTPSLAWVYDLHGELRARVSSLPQPRRSDVDEGP